MANVIITINYVSNIHKRIQCTCMNTIFNTMSVLYSFATKPFLLLNNFNTKILNQLIFTFIVNYEKIIINHRTNS